MMKLNNIEERGQSSQKPKIHTVPCIIYFNNLLSYNSHIVQFMYLK